MFTPAWSLDLTLLAAKLKVFGFDDGKMDFNDMACSFCHGSEPAFNTCCSESPDQQYIALHCYPDSDYSELHSRVDETSQTQTPTAALDTPSSTTGPHLDMFLNSDVDIPNPQDNSQEQSSRWGATSLTHQVHKNIGRSSSLKCQWTNWHVVQKTCYDCPSFEVWIEGLDPTY